ncbi:MAG: response regulator [Clostridiales bacterium]|nr:response regulator [Clostridiales bacterium]
MKSFRVRMTLLIVLVVLASTGLLSVVSYQRAKKSVFAQSEENYRVAAEKYSRELTAWINTKATIIDTLATQIEISGIYDGDREAFHQYLLSNYEKLNRNDDIYDFYFTYPDNTMACASDFVVDGTVDYVHDREWYTTAASTRALFYSTPYMDSDTKQPIITISKAVYKGDTLQGVLAADIFVDTLVNIISEAEVAQDSYAFLVDENLGMIVHPDEAYDFDDVPHGIMDVSGVSYEKVVDTIREGSGEMVYIDDYDGVTRGIVVTSMADTGWYVGIATSRAQMMYAVRDSMKGFLITEVIAILVGGVFAVFLALVLEKLNKQQQEYTAHVLKLEKQAADEASEAKSRFLADMSHEIRTPINAILGMNEVIYRESDSRDIRGYSRNIRQSGQNLLQLVNSILDFSKIENGKMEIVPARYSVKSQIAYVMNSISERARAKFLEVELDVDPNIPSELYGDNTRINEIIMNLLTNAVKYTEKGTVTLTIREKERRPGPDASTLLYVEVKDTGIGIKESDMSKLFESFERLDVVRNRNIEGTGLGISVTTKLLSLMGSELKVKSTYGVGSTFWFELWQKIEDEEPLGDIKAKLNDEDGEVTYQESFRAPEAKILVVDDTKMNIVVVVNLLKRTDIQVNTAISGQDAIRLASEKKYDLILMDQRMPGMDGTTAMKTIRESEDTKNRETPIICLTADVVRGAKEKYIEEGFNDYLTKPVDARALEKMLLNYLPKDKILMEQAPVTEEGNAEEGTTAALLAALNKAGVDTKTGLFFCQNDEEMYKAILAEYCMEQKMKSLNLQNCYERKDWKNYEIHVHSLKSTSKTIGLKKLSSMAADLEAAAGRGDEMTLEDGHGKVMKMYEKCVRDIEETLGVADEDMSEEGEVFEFLPEGNILEDQDE